MQVIDFNQVNWYALRAAAAYQKEADIRRTFPDTVKVATTGEDIQYFIESNATQQVVSIRGTANLDNAFEDASYAESENPQLDIYVHCGFDKTATQLYREIKPELDKSKPVILTGHSLGAAISTLLMMYLHHDGFSLGPSINFGQPKITNSHGADKYSFLPLLRVVDENDVVPLVPPNDLIDAIHGGYQHLGPELMLLAGEYYVYEDTGAIRHSSIDAFWRNLGDTSVSAHFMANYLKNIASKTARAILVPYQRREEYMDA
ncbi:lipase family protein [Microbulbifer hainanensis]|uniref:lipase family protein n=1 Tax=Microbulbifer hainanensis TaxID=2735675 RepID=UPI0018663E72|nr:lipase family protein [Microbulbifer hainanensis]